MESIIYEKLRKMNTQIIKPILGGLIIGAALFFMPFFVLKVLVFLLIIGLLFRLFGWRRGWRHYRGPYGWAFADKIRNMSDEDYEHFKVNWSSRCYRNKSKDVQTEEKNS